MEWGGYLLAQKQDLPLVNFYISFVLRYNTLSHMHFLKAYLNLNHWKMLDCELMFTQTSTKPQNRFAFTEFSCCENKRRKTKLSLNLISDLKFNFVHEEL